MPEVPLILRRTRLWRGLGVLPAQLPTAVAVYATATGEIPDVQPQGWRDRLRGRFAWRYEVDTSVYHRTARVQIKPLPARGDVHFFDALMTIDFQVKDARAVVRANVTDAVPIVYRDALKEANRIARTHSIEEVGDAEREINEVLAQLHEVPPYGIAIHFCAVRLSLDQGGRRYLEEMREPDRREKVEAAQHLSNMGGVRRNGEIEMGRLALRLEREQMERDAIAKFDVRALIKLHVVRHPEDLATATNLLLAAERAAFERRDPNDPRWMEILQFMTENKLLKPGDVERFREQALRRLL